MRYSILFLIAFLGGCEDAPSGQSEEPVTLPALY